ncbi:cdc42 effector protein 3 [Eucyclogobius newberryi]|uniref:cdc42 effector protein 3 n=1 Tax=Eucyclogobius newberryi TaxID=166745 RepID=UPI003B592341
MPAKAPIYLKPAPNKKGKKCRLRDILSPDMISPPLGDFRHTIHIGRGGQRDTFGDISFLQGNYELLPGKEIQYGVQGEYTRANSTGNDSYAETPSPVLKNAISLPTIGGCQALSLPMMSSHVYSMPPEPLEDILGPPIKPDHVEEVEILQMDALLRSMDVFGSEPSSPNTEMLSKPDVLLDLLEKKHKSKSKAKMTKSNWSDKLSSFSSYKTNGSLNSDASSDSFESIKDDYKPKTYNENGNCNGFGYFDKDLNFKEELPKCNGDWVDRDSGVDEGRMCDFDFEFVKEKSSSHDSLSQITGSLLSLELDLGPSILDDVLNIMDKPTAVKSRP